MHGMECAPHAVEGDPMTKLELPDPFIRRVLGPVLIVLVVLVLTPGTLALLIGLPVSRGAAEPEWALNTYRFWRSANSLPWDLVALGGNVLPPLATALVFRAPSQRRLTTVGRTAFVLLILGVALALLAMIITGAIQSRNIDGGQDTLDLLRSGANASFTLCATNLGLILGVRTPIKPTGA